MSRPHRMFCLFAALAGPILAIGRADAQPSFPAPNDASNPYRTLRDLKKYVKQ